ncbi:hypothetical protein FO519_005687 [Halicephalobus sp. NKZ332]|nr:hypothetical protein FO519_005687 [Halicephalobus sp. NKZ332]
MSTKVIMKLLLCFPLCFLVLQSVLGDNCPGKTYTVDLEDTCRKIWTSNNITEEQFYELNPEIYCGVFFGVLNIGDEVCISVSEPKVHNASRQVEENIDESSSDEIDQDIAKSSSNDTSQGNNRCKEKIHKIESGDTCEKIQDDYGLTMEQFDDLNPRVMCSSLNIGSEVCVPDRTRFNANRGPGFKVTLYQQFNQIDNAFGVLVSGCTNLIPAWDDRASSINTHDNCIRVYTGRDCSERSRLISPGTYCHSHLTECNMNKKISSMKPC